MNDRWSLNISFIEEGNIYFFYKPKKDKDIVQGMQDVGRFYFVLEPAHEKPIRFIVMGHKKMPEITNGGKTRWGFVEKVGGRGFRVRSTEQDKPTRPVPPLGARPAGEGIYAIARHGDHTHLVYSLELPHRVGIVQNAFNIKRQANYVINVEEPGSERKFVAVHSPKDLNVEGAELLLTGHTSSFERLGIEADRDIETEASAEIFNQLMVDKERHPIEPLMKGKWR